MNSGLAWLILVNILIYKIRRINLFVKQAGILNFRLRCQGIRIDDHRLVPLGDEAVHHCGDLSDIL
jgi:hypothetical protein